MTPVVEILHLNGTYNHRVLESSIELAVSEAPAMVIQHITRESPLLPLAEAEVEFIIRHSVQYGCSGLRQKFNGVMCDVKTGFVVALEKPQDGSTEMAGFIQYKPRLLASGIATIGYAAVAPEFRRKGVLRQMLETLRTAYPILGLDCPLELVPMYEGMGFKPNNVQGAHVGMSTGTITGQSWGIDQSDLENDPKYMYVKANVERMLGARLPAEYAKRDQDTQQRAAEVRTMLASRGVS